MLAGKDVLPARGRLLQNSENYGAKPGSEYQEPSIITCSESLLFRLDFDN